MRWTLVLLLILFFLPQRVFAQQHYQREDNLFGENFQRNGDTLANTDQWFKESENNNLFFIVTDTLLARDFWPNSHGYLTTRFDLGDNYVFELDLVNYRGTEEGVSFRRKDPNNAYELSFHHDTSEIVLTKIEQGHATILKSTTQFLLINNYWYHPKIEIFDTCIQVWIDNQFLFAVDDPQTQLHNGAISLSYSTGTLGYADIAFDNIRVASITPQLLNPVIFIPGLAGSQLQADSDIIWSAADGHGGIFSHAFTAGEKLWVNLDQAILLGDDDYFDVLRLQPDGQTSAAAVSPNGWAVEQGYGSIDQIFKNMGYIKGVNYFFFAYDWRQDVMTASNLLDQLIDTARHQNNQSQVDLVVHSLGGLVVRAYLDNQLHSPKINRLIEIGVPHLGTPKAAYNVIYGSPLGKTFLGFSIGIAGSEIKDLLQNFPSIFQLFPSSIFFQFYPPWLQNQRDLNYNFMADLNHTAISLADILHQRISPNNLPPNVSSYQIVGSGQPTMGQVTESWWVNWPIKLIPKTDATYINGDGTVPLYSASLKSDQLDFSKQTPTFYVEEDHNQLVQLNSQAFGIVNSILSSSSPATQSAQPLEGVQLSIDQDAELELDDPLQQLSLEKIGSTTHLFVKKKQASTKVKINTKSKTINIKVRHYSNDKINKTDYYHQIPVIPEQSLSLFLDPATPTAPLITNGTQSFYPSAETSETSASDQTPPHTNVQINNSLITLDTQDFESGTLNTEYSLDSGQTIYTYSTPFSISTPGTFVLQVFSTDKVGNQEMPQIQTITVSSPPGASNTPSPSPSPTPNSQILITNLPPTPQPPTILAAAVNPRAEDDVQNPRYRSTALIMILFLYAYLNTRRLAGL